MEGCCPRAAEPSTKPRMKTEANNRTREPPERVKSLRDPSTSLARRHRFGHEPGRLHLAARTASSAAAPVGERADPWPVMEAGLDRDALQQAPKPEALPGRVEVPTLEAPGRAPNNLAAQRWGVIAPEGSDGDALLSAISPLIEVRQKEQGGADAEAVPRAADQDAKAALKWRNEVLRAVPMKERPKYLLILGDLRHISIELQLVLAHSNYVGRLHVGEAHGELDPTGYAAYAEKVVAHARRTELDEAPGHAPLHGS